MKQVQEELKKWRIARNLEGSEFNTELEVLNLLKEFTEYLEAETKEHKAEELSDMIIFCVNGLSYLNEDYNEHYNPFDSEYILKSLSHVSGGGVFWQALGLNEIINACYDDISNLGFYSEKLILEKIKVLNSRKQCPKQAREWEIIEFKELEKWEKDPEQNKDELYKMDFELCRK